jgi:hypothetical protein
MPVTRSTTVATRGRVHNSALKPWWRAPLSRAASTLRSCAALIRGFLPARPAAFRAPVPPFRHCRYQRDALCLVTFNCRAIEASEDSPLANRRAACLRRRSREKKSRVWRLAIPELYGCFQSLSLINARYCHSIMRDSIGTRTGPETGSSAQ